MIEKCTNCGHESCLFHGQERKPAYCNCWFAGKALLDSNHVPTCQVDKFPILSLMNGRLLSNVKRLPEVLRQPGRSNKADAHEAAESIDHLINMVERLSEELRGARGLLRLADVNSTAVVSISKLLQELGLE